MKFGIKQESNRKVEKTTSGKPKISDKYWEHNTRSCVSKVILKRTWQRTVCWKENKEVDVGLCVGMKLMKKKSRNQSRGLCAGKKARNKASLGACRVSMWWS